jgi:hypothetical protein
MLGAAGLAGLVGGQIIGGVLNYNANKQLADAQEDAARAQMAEGRRQFDLTRSDLAPQRQLGGEAINRLLAILNGEIPELTDIPGYEFQFEQGMNALNRSNAAKGMTRSGAAMKGAERFGQGLASGTYQNYINQLLSEAGFAPTATSQGIQAGGQYLANYGNAQQGIFGAAGARATGLSEVGADIGSITNTLGQYIDDRSGVAPPPTRPNWTPAYIGQNGLT